MRLLFGAQTRAETDQQPGPVSAIVGEQLLLVGRPQRVAVADQRFEPRTEILRVTRRQRRRQFGTPALPERQPMRPDIGGTGEIGRAHVLTPVTTAHIVCPLLLV